MSRALHLYQYIAPTVLAPLSFVLWWTSYGNLPQVLVAWLVPILWAYIVPGVGTNILKVWEFDVGWKLGRFRPHHGFVFGSATASIAWLLHGEAATRLWDVARYSIVMASVLGFWNLLYDIRALKAGVLRVYNQPWAEGRGEESVAMDYAPWFFGGFGAAYGLAVAGFERFVGPYGVPGFGGAALALVLALVFTLALPVAGFILQSLRRYGHPGTRPVERKF
jgi:hypothetical protein